VVLVVIGIVIEIVIGRRILGKEVVEMVIGIEIIKEVVVEIKIKVVVVGKMTGGIATSPGVVGTETAVEEEIKTGQRHHRHDEIKRKIKHNLQRNEVDVNECNSNKFFFSYLINYILIVFVLLLLLLLF
jgi:hypothetical protein